jgi:putative transposase
LFFLHLETRRVTLAGITQHPTEEWMLRMARRAVDDIDGSLRSVRFVLHDRDTKFCACFRPLYSAGVGPLRLPARSPDLNAYAERRVRTIKSECLSKLILFGEASLRRSATQFVAHNHCERPHQGKGNRLLFPAPASPPSRHPGRVHCRQRLAELLKFYQHAA